MSLAIINKVRRLQKLRESRPAPLPSQTDVGPPSLQDYYKARYPGYDSSNWHIEAILSELANLEPGDLLILNLSPRAGKTDLVGAFLEWRIGMKPQDEVIYGSYAAKLAKRRSRKIRNEITTGACFRRFFPQVTVAKDSSSINEWHTNQGGQFLAAGVDGPVTGTGMHVGVVDDPLKGRKQAESPTQRETVINWFKSDLLTRLSPDGIMIVIQTRWHVQDLAGWLIENFANDDTLREFRIKQLSVPALADDTTSLSDKDPRTPGSGESYWPQRWPRGKLERNRKILGEYDFLSLYQQSPIKPGGNHFSNKPARYTTPHLDDGHIAIVCDLAASKNKGADFTVYCVAVHWGANEEERHIDILEIRRGNWGLDMIHYVGWQLQAKYGAIIDYECVADDIRVIQHIENPQTYTIEGEKVEVPAIYLEYHNPRGSKLARALPAAAAWNDGRIRLPIDAPWVNDHVKEHAEFTGNEGKEKDDQVDTTSRQWDIGATIITSSTRATPGSAGGSRNQVSGTFRG